MSSLAYPPSESTKLAQIQRLFDDWETHFASLPQGSLCDTFEGITQDGFYPYYFSQRLRILFIGKESVGLDSHNYLEVLAHCYRTEKRVGDQHLHTAAFHSRMLHIAHGILHDIDDWDEIPWASEIGDTFAMEDGISFAFMNLSKVSNESGDWKADWDSISSASKASLEPRNFPREQIELLEPDVIISMNIAERLAPVLGEMSQFCATGQAEGYSVMVSGKRTLLINTWHFSGRGSHVERYYGPIRDIMDRWSQIKGSHLS